MKLTVAQMAARFDAYNHETTRFIFGAWADMSVSARDAQQAEIDARHGYRHGWITVDGESFDQYSAYPEQSFANVWD